MKASAPGKMVLLGDYAVLEGGRALVAAVDRRAEGVVDPDGPVPSPVVEAVLQAARAAGFSPPARVRIETGGFLAPGGEKLGVGSSAAVAVVTAALATQRQDEVAFRIALDGHRRAAGGEGSGIDVASSFHGGYIVTKSQPHEVVQVKQDLPGLHQAVLFSKESASTKELVGACRASARWEEWTAHMRRLTEVGVSAWESGDAQDFLSVVSQYGRAMEGLGRDAGVSVVTEVIEGIMRYAEEGGGAAKPSGAGGGDVVVLFAKDAGLAAKVAERTGTDLLNVRPELVGLQLSS